MRRRDAAIFTALTDAFCEPRDPFPQVSDTDAVAFMGELLAASPAVNRLGFRVLLRVLETAPLARGYRGRFLRLSGSERREFLHGLDRSRFLLARIAARLLKTLTIMCYWGDPRVLAAAGYDADANIARAHALRQREGRP